MVVKSPVRNNWWAKFCWQNPKSTIETPKSKDQRPKSKSQRPTPKSNVQSAKSQIPSPKLKVQSPETKVQSSLRLLPTNFCPPTFAHLLLPTDCCPPTFAYQLFPANFCPPTFAHKFPPHFCQPIFAHQLSPTNRAQLGIIKARAVSIANAKIKKNPQMDDVHADRQRQCAWGIGCTATPFFPRARQVGMGHPPPRSGCPSFNFQFGA